MPHQLRHWPNPRSLCGLSRFCAMRGELGSLLGRWHQWRAAYSHERGYAQVRMPAWFDEEEEDWEARAMQSLEDEITRLPQELQLALQHVARAECLGVEVIMLNRLPQNKAARDALCERALKALEARLLALDLL
jgi:hypothetical protein